MHHTASGYLPALDGLRAVSILLVVVSHMGLGEVVPGGLGVTLFFFISGYIITTILLREYAHSRTVDIKAFYIRRLWRLTPALYGYVLATILLSLLFGLAIDWRDVGAVLLYAANYWDIFRGFGLPGTSSPFSITWSLAVEEHFYLFFPALLLLSLHRRWHLSLILSLLIVGILAWRIWLVQDTGIDQLSSIRIYKASDTRIDSILYGALFAWLFPRLPRCAAAVSTHWSLCAGLLLLLVSLAFRDPVFRETWRYSLQGVATMLIFAPLVLSRTVWSELLASTPLVYIGKISYSLYLYHWLVLCFSPYWLTGTPWPLRALTELTLSFLLAHLSYRYIERIGRRGKAGWVRA